jgi:hypothetical protein
MALLFSDAPDNCELPSEWLPYIEAMKRRQWVERFLVCHWEGQARTGQGLARPSFAVGIGKPP